jgi:hypothetical protein
MDRSQADADFLDYWNGIKRKDDRFLEVLKIVEITPEKYDTLKRELKKVTKRRSPYEILIPMGGANY